MHAVVPFTNVSNEVAVRAFPLDAACCAFFKAYLVKPWGCSKFLSSLILKLSYTVSSIICTCTKGCRVYNTSNVGFTQTVDDTANEIILSMARMHLKCIIPLINIKVGNFTFQVGIQVKVEKHTELYLTRSFMEYHTRNIIHIFINTEMMHTVHQILLHVGHTCSTIVFIVIVHSIKLQLKHVIVLALLDLHTRL